MTRHIFAECDASLTARVLRRRPLFYSCGADPSLDRPTYVRAGSGLSRVGDCLLVIQDDANFVAVIEPGASTVGAITLPPGFGGQRQFDDLRRNKRWKLDLEACLTMTDEGRELFVAFGSGSSPSREQVLVIAAPSAAATEVKLYHAPAFYAALRSHSEFSGSELNVEGAAFLGNDCLRLFQRGNGARRADCLPRNASCDISWRMFWAQLGDPAAVQSPPRNVVSYDLGMLGGIPLTFTDVAVSEESVFFTATAEASPNEMDDGPVVGSVLGQINADGTARWAVLEDEHGNRLHEKAEGLSFDFHTQNHVWILIDPDNPLAPSELCEVELLGDWVRQDPTIAPTTP